MSVWQTYIAWLDGDLKQWSPPFSRAFLIPVIALLPNFVFAIVPASDQLRYSVLGLTILAFMLLLGISTWRFSVSTDRKHASQKHRNRSKGQVR